ncbi:hypothetical protein JQ617_08095 [Bradyrhizobium sp. KB893862 SZCCT0404]|uniref:hypothetical protein n=1 Tax=Bradyrhizobium sp. KB893862 SZCCT0404 TaxID=2807672 RepID=UPI001BA46C83|nr:hypothetical protein [Bradyrhizobium sp. KB893862 SZCCT0404]MBR1173911.1 hypothetical protein [Bradyrhizobium sp. KB893862 SZCCT0404]
MNILDLIKNFIRFEFSFESGKTVSSITANLTKTVKDLEAHAAQQVAYAQRKTVAAAKALKEHAEHTAEVEAARKVAANIKNLLG